MEKMSPAVLRGEKKKIQTSLFYETDLVTVPLALDLQPRPTAAAGSSPDGWSTSHRDRLTTAKGDGGLAEEDTGLLPLPVESPL